ncbi:membrane protein [Mixta theicola]|nr:membrane protein [Mixta theicola]
MRIIAVHKDKYSYSVLVDDFPKLARQKIIWWVKNKERVINMYGLSDSSDTADFNIYFWRFGDGYNELGKYDRLCFEDMPPPKNCIEKDRLMYITLTRNGEVSYWLNDTRYIQKADGRLVEVGFN